MLQYLSGFAQTGQVISFRRHSLSPIHMPLATVAAKSAKPTTPLVFVIGQDPVKAGLLARLDRPGGNATGVSDFVNQLVGKRLELIQQAAARVESVGLLVNPRNPNTESSKEKEAAVIALAKTLLVVRAMNGRDRRHHLRHLRMTGSSVSISIRS
jgi:ABC-type uncharacterized transport system substrate-binding protein